MVELTHKNFEEFVMDAHELFEPSGTRFYVYRRVGYNDLSNGMFKEFEANAQPEWVPIPDLWTFDRMETKFREKRLWVNIWFKEDWYEAIGVSPDMTWKLAFEPKKALYIKDEWMNGTHEFPYEYLYVRL